MDRLRNIDFSVFFDFWRKRLYFLDCVLNRCNRFDFHCKRQPIGTVINRDFQPALRYYIVFLFVLRRDADIFGNDNAYGSIFADFLAEESLQRKQVRSKSADTKAKRIYCYGSPCDYCNNGILLCIEIFQHGELNTEYTVCNNKFYGCVLNIQTQSVLCRMPQTM